ncbi:MAG: bis(5'-nucleosyl)-tetraphosphatase [Thermoplasmatales archaeon]|nr:bis(5'-nucleosyl)-tetraphosphatase [Thermoplasmatales archaeon]
MIRNEISSGILVYRVKNGLREYLFLRRKEGFLDLTKGHIEEGESDLMAAKMETLEESGLDVEPIKGFREEMHYSYSGRGCEINKTVIMFLGKSGENAEPRISHEHVGFVWLNYEDALNKVTFRNQKDLIMHAETFIEKNNQLQA